MRTLLDRTAHYGCVTPRTLRRLLSRPGCARFYKKKALTHLIMQSILFRLQRVASACSSNHRWSISDSMLVVPVQPSQAHTADYFASIERLCQNIVRPKVESLGPKSLVRKPGGYNESRCVFQDIND